MPVSRRRGTDASARHDALVASWYAASCADLDVEYAAWLDDAVLAIADATGGSGDLDDACLRVGAARASAGWTERDALCDFSNLLDAIAAAGLHPIDDARAVAALTQGRSLAQACPATPLVAGVDATIDALTAAYHRSRQVRQRPGDVLAMAIFDADIAHRLPVERALVVHRLTTETRWAFPSVECVGVLRDDRIVVLARRHAGLASALEEHRRALVHIAGLDGADVTVAALDLPGSAAALPGFVRSLARDAVGLRTVPVQSMAPRPSTLTRPVSLVGALRWSAHRAWKRGLDTAAAGVAAVLVAMGIAQVIGPADASAPVTATTLAPLIGRAPAPAPIVDAPLEAGGAGVTGTTVVLEEPSPPVPAPAPSPDPVAPSTSDGATPAVSAPAATGSEPAAQPAVESPPAAPAAEPEESTPEPSEPPEADPSDDADWSPPGQDGDRPGRGHGRGGDRDRDRDKAGTLDADEDEGPKHGPDRPRRPTR